MLFQSVLARFFAIPARQPASGAVTFAQMRVLWIIDLEKDATLSRVAKWLGVTNSTATELVDRLVKARYVRREQSPEDRRQVMLSLRDRGRKMLADYAERRRERFQRLMRVVRKEDVDRMVSALETMNGILGKWNGSR